MTIYLENMDNIISHHPVHILDADGELSPSSFIPFCEFGSNKRMGMKSDKFSFPVCNSFKPTTLFDRLCYKIDLNEYKTSDNLESTLKNGFIFFIDYNEDRQTETDKVKVEVGDLFHTFVNIKKDKKSMIFLGSIGM